MKLKNFLLALMCIALVSACSDNETTSIDYVMEETPAATVEPEIISNLKSFNDSLHMAHQGTRISILGAFAVAYSDIKGASEGALVGGSIGSLIPGVGTAIGADIGALIYGTGASYLAYIAVSEFENGIMHQPSISPISGVQTDVERSYNLMAVHPELVEEQASVCAPLNSIPKEFFEDCKKVGVYHNAMLDAMRNNSLMIEAESAPNAMTNLETDIVHSDDFKSAYEKYVYEGQDDSDLLAKHTPFSDVLNLFYDAYHQCEDMEDVYFICENYAKAIEQSTELTEDEKYTLYIALSVAVYSTHYWLENLPA